MARRKGNPKAARYTSEFKLRVVRTVLDKNLTPEEGQRVFGVSDVSVKRWIQLFRDGGESALGDSRPSKPEPKPDPNREKLREQIVELKTRFPYFGVARLWLWIRRTLFVKVSRRFVGRTLKEKGLVEPVVKKKRRSPKIKFFERAKPNQLWQSDITEFTLARGLVVYLIAFMDDHSRYIVGWGLYAGCSGALVLEVLRNAFATYGRPGEILTDNGRQYKCWRGVTEFEKELRREGIHHITSRPHHPQTLGKIESFWGHLKREFLAHVVMGGLEDMRERLAHWIAYYNFQRPHEGIKNVTPAERYFKYSALVREEIEKRIRKNEQDLAFASRSRGPIGQMPLGDTTLEVRKDGDEFVVRVGDKEVKRVDLKEDDHETQKAAVGADRDPGSGGQGQGVDRAAGSGGGEDDRPGLPGDGAQAASVLPAGDDDDPGDAARGEDARRPQEGSDPGGDEPRAQDGGASTGAPTDAEPAANQPKVTQVPQNAQNRPETAENGTESGGGGTEAQDPGGNPDDLKE